MSLPVTAPLTLTNLLEEYRPRLLAMVRRRLDPALAPRVEPEDVLAEAFVRARGRWDQFQREPGRAPYPWLYRIVLDCLIDAWRRETRDCRDPRRDLPWPEDSSVQMGLGLVSPGTSPSEAAAREDLRQRMRQALDLLRD